MYNFNELKNLMDTNKCLSTLASRVTHQLTRRGLLISEDITFIDTLIDSQLDFQTNKDCLEPNSRFLNNNVLIIFSLTSGLIWFESSFTSYRPLFGSIICCLSWKLSSFAYNLMNQIYLKHRLIGKLVDLNERLTKERDLINKYFKLIEDYEAVEDNGKHLTTISEMKEKFRIICWNRFKTFREITLKLRKTFPLNSEIDEEMNYLCCLPIETFDKFISEDKSVISLSLLKSLMHLKRLQQSECFRRIICLFLTICLDKTTHNQMREQYFQSTSNYISDLFYDLIQEFKRSFPQLLSDYKCAKSLWISSEKSLIKCRDLKQTNQTIETINLLNTNRSIRKHLFTSLNLLDDCDSLIEDGIQCNQFRHKVRQKLDSISDEFKSINGLVINLEKILRIEDIRESNSKPVIKSDQTNESSMSSMSANKFEEYVVKDQVFEAIVTENCDNDIDLDSNDDQMWENRLKIAEQTDASNNLFRELKVALKSKAVEHKKREAKALGLEFDESLESNLETENLEQIENKPFSDNYSENSSINLNQIQSNSLFQKSFIEKKVENENISHFSPNSFGFQSEMATIAAQKALFFTSNKQTENFGDDSDSTEEEEEENQK